MRVFVQIFNSIFFLVSTIVVKRYKKPTTRTSDVKNAPKVEKLIIFYGLYIIAFGLLVIFFKGNPNTVHLKVEFAVPLFCLGTVILVFVSENIEHLKILHSKLRIFLSHRREEPPSNSILFTVRSITNEAALPRNSIQSQNIVVEDLDWNMKH